MPCSAARTTAAASGRCSPSGPRAERQRDTIARALAPVWEANHVWLVLAIVILFTGFPSAFAAIATALHVPLTLLLFGIVLRGSAFVFRAYDGVGNRPNRSWGRLFAVASAVTPLLIGMLVGALTEGNIHVVRGQVQAGLFHSWTTPFCCMVGIFALSLFAFLAAVFLTLEADSPALANDFRRRALTGGVAVACLALAVFWASNAEVRDGLTRRSGRRCCTSPPACARRWPSSFSTPARSAGRAWLPPRRCRASSGAGRSPSIPS